MPEAGEYLLSNVGWSKDEEPYISLQRAGQFHNLFPRNQTLTLRITTEQRYCIGWGDIATGERFACPENNRLDDKYEQCPHCQKRTGFNPAFYHATSVSTQQEERNRQPHILYLAHFGPGCIKVGISLAARGKSRLLEQGARSALILDTFPSALIARQYEAQIAQLPDVVETMQLRKKIILLAHTYHSASAKQELLAMRSRIEKNVGISFTPHTVMHLDPFYFPDIQPALAQSHDCSDKQLISGTVTGMLGSLLYCSQNDNLLYLPIKKYIGYHATLTYDETPISLPARQTSLF